MTALIILITLLVLFILGAVVAINAVISKISYDVVDDPAPDGIAAGDDMAAGQPTVIDPAYAAGNGIYFPDLEEIHGSDIINVLLLGTDAQINTEERGRADSNILCSLNLKTGEIKLISFERGIGVPIPGRGSDLLTHAYRWGGPALSQSIISQMFCVEVNGYAQADFQSFAGIVDAIGGVDVELTELEAKALNGEIPTQTWTWDPVHEGWNHLYGHDALEYCRLRAIDSDWNRQQRQRTVLEQIQKKCRAMSPVELLKLADQVLPLIHTNLSREEVATILKYLPRLMRGTVSQLQVPDKNQVENTIRCVPDYESKKIANFLYDAGYELVCPY